MTWCVSLKSVHCGAGWNPAADCQSAFPSLSCTTGRPIANRPQDSILPHIGKGIGASLFFLAATLAAQTLNGVVDIHAHSDPDSVPRSIDAIDAAKLAHA